MTRRQAHLADTILEVIDNSDGISVLKIEEVMMQAVSFRDFVTALNILYDRELIQIDTDHVAHRVRR